jgi:hypothetical protein
MALLEIEWDPRRQQQKEVGGSESPGSVGENPAEEEREHRSCKGKDAPPCDERAQSVAEREGRGEPSDRLEVEGAVSVEIGVGEPPVNFLGDETYLAFVRVERGRGSAGVPPQKEQAKTQREQE